MPMLLYCKFDILRTSSLVKQEFIAILLFNRINIFYAHKIDQNIQVYHSRVYWNSATSHLHRHKVGEILFENEGFLKKFHAEFWSKEDGLQDTKNPTNRHLRKHQSFISINYSILLFLKGVSFIITTLEWIIKVNSLRLFVFFFHS